MNNMERRSNIELLRIVSMIMIVVLHINNHGGLLGSATPLSGSSLIIQLTETLSYVSVNCYIFISGYFLINSQFKLRKIFKLWSQVFFYSIGLYTILVITKQITFTNIAMIKTILPFSFDSYWFITIYLALYIISPFLNLAIKSMSKSQLKICIGTMVLLFSILYINNSLGVKSGYSLYWFVCLYFVGAYVKLYHKINYKWKKYFYGYLLCSVFDYILSIAVMFISLRAFGVIKGSSCFIAYNWLFTFIGSLSLFLAAINFKIKNENISKLVLWFSPLTFGVYLIHDHSQFRTILWEKILQPSKYLYTPYAFLIFIVMVISIYLVCSLIEFIRSRIFYKFENGVWFDELIIKIKNKKIFEKIKKNIQKVIS